jgi:Guanine nucleotide exchange factor synembryn
MDGVILEVDGITPAMAINEILRTCFTLTINNTEGGGGFFGSLASTPEKEVTEEDKKAIVAKYSKYFFLTSILNALIKCSLKTQLETPPLSNVHESVINALMNIPVSALRHVWFYEQNMPIVQQVADIFEKTVKHVLPAGTESPDYSMELNGQPLDNALAPIMILLKNWAMDDETVCGILRARFMPADLYFYLTKRPHQTA